MTVKPDFSGYASKNGLLCADGRVISPGAFKHQDKQKVPLVWQHQRDKAENILGYAVLENRPEGVYTYGYFNDSDAGQTAKELVQHGDIEALSIFANKLVHQGRNVVHGDLKEVSLVLSGANPGAFIDYVNLAHAENGEVDESEAIIYTGETLQHGEDTDDSEEESEEETEGEEVPVNKTDDSLEHAEQTVGDIFNAFTEEQKNVVYYMIGQALEEAGAASLEQGDTIDAGEVLSHIETYIEEGFTNMTRNVFDQTGGSFQDRPTLSHDQLKTIVTEGWRSGSLKESFLEHAGTFGIDDIDFLFPDARTISNSPDFLSRRMEWVDNVLSSTKHSPFSRIKSIVADITADEARARGYVKGNLKKDEVIKLLKRVTTPKTVYKKQKLDRDDIIDITDIDVVTWLKMEMRLMLDEEIAAAILVGDGREPDDEDKIDEDHLRPIAYDNDMYTHVVELDGTPTPSELVDAIVRSRKYYKGTGSPTFYTTDDELTDMILDKDTLGRRFYATEAELAAALRVKQIVVVEAMERAADVVGILVNLTDYTIGADKGGEIGMFDDFDIDYNQQKYLIETRISGALTKPKSAVVIKRNPGTIVTPAAPSFVSGTGVVTIVAQTGVVYKNADTGATLTAGAQDALASGDSIEIEALPATGYSFPHGFDADWVFTRP